MGYQTGVATNADNLKTIIETFALANGWTLSGGILSNGSCHVRVDTPSPNERVRVQGAIAVDFSSGVSPGTGEIWTSLNNFPVTYHLVGTAQPEIFCIVEYNNVFYQWVAFGKVEKYGAYTGGEWIAGTFGNEYDVRESGTYNPDGTPTLPQLLPQGGQKNGSGATGALLWGGYASGWASDTRDGSQIHCELDGDVWCDGVRNGSGTHIVTFAPYANPLHVNQPNLWNSQAVLIPYWLWKKRPAYKASVIGHVPGIKALQIDNYTGGDIITIGTEQWIVFPWIKKEQNPSGWEQSGTLGWALKYDGP